MALSGVGDLTPELSNLLGTSAFAANRTKQNVQPVEPPQVEDIQKTDFVSLSDKALQLSREALATGRTVKETK